MPKILPTPLTPARAAFNGLNSATDAALSRASRADSRKEDRSGGFDEVLSGARRRKNEPKPPERDRTPAAPEKAQAPKAKERPVDRRAESSGERDVQVESPTASADETAAPQATDEERPVDASGPPEEEPVDAHASDSNETQVEEPNATALPIAIDAELPIDSATSSSAASDVNGAAPSNESPEDQATGTAPVAGTRPPTAVDGLRLQEGTFAQELDMGALPAADPSSAAPVGDVSSAGNPAAQTKPGVAPASGVARPMPRTVAVEASPDAGQAQKQAATHSDALPAAASNGADAVEAIDSTNSRPPTSASSASPQAAPDPAAAVRVLENFAAQQAKHADVSPSPTSLPQATPEARFAQDNHPTIVAGVRGQLLPTGGTMHLRLDPPELGPLAVTVRLHNGVMEASFETTNDEAARLLSHSLGTLKSSLESQGVNVERLHVHQAPKSEQSNQNGNNNDREGQQGQNRDAHQDHAARQDHQRREMLRRMWRKLTGVEDPLDMVA